MLSTAPVSSLATLSTNLFGGVPVSISATGQVQQGGGTTIYKNIGAINTVQCPYYMSGTAIYEDIFLVSYENKVTGQGTINVMSVDSNRNTNLLNTSFISHDLYGLVTLNKGTGLFASISQNGALVGTDPVVIAGSVNKKKGYSINFGPATLYSTGASVDPSITSLSNTTFAIAYFACHYYAYTKFGTSSTILFM